MLENINELIKGIRERFASPFFFSFILAWIFWNWKVTIALVWYNSNLYQKGDLIKYIEDNTSSWESFWLPILIAALYTGLLKNLISAFVTASSKWGGNWNLSISKGSNVPMSKFLTYRNLYLETSKTLEKVIKDESKTIEEFEKEKQKVLRLEADKVFLNGEVTRISGLHNELSLQHNALSETARRQELTIRDQEVLIERNEKLSSNYRNEKFMNGQWKFTYSNRFLGFDHQEIFRIHNGTVDLVNGARTTNYYQISHFFYDTINKRILILLKFIPETTEADYIQKLTSEARTFRSENTMQLRAYYRTRYSTTLIHELEVKDEKLLTGTENGEALISYERLDRGMPLPHSGPPAPFASK